MGRVGMDWCTESAMVGEEDGEGADGDVDVLL